MKTQSKDYYKGHKDGLLQAHNIVYQLLDVALGTEQSQDTIDALRNAALTILAATNEKGE